MNTYEVYFDIRETSLAGSIFNILLIGFEAFVLVLVVSIVWLSRKNGQRISLKSITGGLLCIALILFMNISFFVRKGQLIGKLEKGEVAVAEGKVEKFGHSPSGKGESFYVAKQYFTISFATMTPAFNQTRSVGGPLEEGLPVKIHHHQGQILRLEIRKASK